MAARGVVGTVDAVAVQGARPRLREITVPHLIGLPTHVDGLDDAPTLAGEDAELDLLGVFGKEREVDAFAVPRRPQRIRRTGPHRYLMSRHYRYCSLPSARVATQQPTKHNKRRLYT